MLCDELGETLRFFPEPAQHALEGDAESAIYAASWARTLGGTRFPLAWDAAYSYVNAYDVSACYARDANAAAAAVLDH